MRHAATSHKPEPRGPSTLSLSSFHLSTILKTTSQGADQFLTLSMFLLLLHHISAHAWLALPCDDVHALPPHPVVFNSHTAANCRALGEQENTGKGEIIKNGQFFEGYKGGMLESLIPRDTILPMGKVGSN